MPRTSRKSVSESVGAPPRRATINDIARLARVSKKTVSRVINRAPFVKDETRQRVDAVMKELGYAPDAQARGLALRRSFLVGLLYDERGAPAVADAQQGVLEAIKGRGFDLVVHSGDHRDAGFLSEVGAFLDRLKLHGVVLLPPLADMEGLLALLRMRGCKCAPVTPSKVAIRDLARAAALRLLGD